MISPAPFDWSAAYAETRRNLPHFRQDNAVYFVTYRTDDSLPAEVIVRWKQQILADLANASDDDRHRELIRQAERFLDNPHGECLLARPGLCDLVAENLLHNDRRRYLLDTYAIMPNHVHVLLMPAPGERLTAIIGDWKRYTSRQINRLCHRHGAFWADEAFDHILREGSSLQRFRQYILANPLKVPHLHTRTGHGSFPELTGL